LPPPPSPHSLHDALPISNVHAERARVFAAGERTRFVAFARRIRLARARQRRRRRFAIGAHDSHVDTLERKSIAGLRHQMRLPAPDRKSTRLNSSHQIISY